MGRLIGSWRRGAHVYRLLWIPHKSSKSLSSDDGINLLHALKAARDAVNARPGTPGYFLFLGTGSHKSLITDMSIRRSQPFNGAVAAAYEVLGRDFVQWQLGRIAAAKEEGISGLFSADALADYAQRTGAAVETTQVQALALAAKLVAANSFSRHRPRGSRFYGGDNYSDLRG